MGAGFGRRCLRRGGEAGPGGFVGSLLMAHGSRHQEHARHAFARANVPCSYRPSKLCRKASLSGCDRLHGWRSIKMLQGLRLIRWDNTEEWANETRRRAGADVFVRVQLRDNITTCANKDTGVSGWEGRPRRERKGWLGSWSRVITAHANFPEYLCHLLRDYLPTADGRRARATW